MKKLLLSLFLCVTCFSAEEPTNANSEFELDSGLVEKLYQESVTESTIATARYSSNITVSPILSIFSPNELTLSNNYFTVPYAAEAGTLPSLSIVGTGRLLSFGGFNLIGLGSVGYSMKEMVQKVSNKNSFAESESITRLTLHWLPIAAGTRLEYQVANFEAIRPYITVKAGAQWLYQVGTLDGLEQGFWVPFYQYGAGLTLFDAPSNPNRWFGGMNVGYSKLQSFSSEQTVEGNVIDIGVNIIL